MMARKRIPADAPDWVKRDDTVPPKAQPEPADREETGEAPKRHRKKRISIAKATERMHDLPNDPNWKGPSAQDLAY
jgi:hypothetical protein